MRDKTVSLPTPEGPERTSKIGGVVLVESCNPLDNLFSFAVGRLFPRKKDKIRWLLLHLE